MDRPKSASSSRSSSYERAKVYMANAMQPGMHALFPPRFACLRKNKGLYRVLCFVFCICVVYVYVYVLII